MDIGLRKLLALGVGGILLCFIMVDASAQWGSVAGALGNMLGGGRRGGSNSRQNSDSQSTQQSQPQSPKTSEKSLPPADDLTYEQFETRLDSFKHELALSSSQDSAWKQFSDKATGYFGLVVRDKARTQNVKLGASPALDGLKLLEQLSETAKSQSKALDGLNVSAKNLYKVLTANQKTIADKSISGFMGPKASSQTAAPTNAGLITTNTNSVYSGPLTTSGGDAKVQIPDFSSSQKPDAEPVQNLSTSSQ